MIKKALGFCALALLLSGAVPAAAGTATLTGTIDPTDPQMPVVQISTPECIAVAAFLVRYEARPFYVTSSGTYNLSLTSPANFASFYLYEVEFDPTNGLLNCIGAANSGTPKQIDESLTALTQYIAVPFDDTFAQTGGSYEMTISGPGDIREGAPAVIEIPTLSTLGFLLLAGLLAVGGLVYLRRLRAA